MDLMEEVAQMGGLRMNLMRMCEIRQTLGVGCDSQIFYFEDSIK